MLSPQAKWAALKIVWNFYLYVGCSEIGLAPAVIKLYLSSDLLFVSICSDSKGKWLTVADL